jgi:hypothetical protein
VETAFRGRQRKTENLEPLRIRIQLECALRHVPVERDSARAANSVWSPVVAALADAKTARRLADLGIEIPPREQQTPAGLRLPCGGDRAVVADHQGGGHQAGVME